MRTNRTFEKTASTDGIGFDEVVEMIDIGGPALVRAAAKNFAHVGVIVDPDDYDPTASKLEENGRLEDSTRLGLAVKAFHHTSVYDSAVRTYLSRVTPDGAADDGVGKNELPDLLHVDLLKVQDLRYGENPHQTAAFYRDPLCAVPTICSTEKQSRPASNSIRTSREYTTLWRSVICAWETSGATPTNGPDSLR